MEKIAIHQKLTLMLREKVSELKGLVVKTGAWLSLAIKVMMCK